MIRSFLYRLTGDPINRIIYPVFNWREVVDHKVYRIRWRGRWNLYATLERAELAFEWLALEGEEPKPIQRLTGYEVTKKDLAPRKNKRGYPQVALMRPNIRPPDAQ